MGHEEQEGPAETCAQPVYGAPASHEELDVTAAAEPDELDEDMQAAIAQSISIHELEPGQKRQRRLESVLFKQ